MKLPEKLQNKVWHTPDGPVDSADMQRVLDAIERGEPRASAIPGVFSDQDRRVDRASQVLKRHGCVEFAGGKWRLVAGRKA